ncbi:hypothetical protein MSSIH_3810 [Methanosarcina siciliae HI350]|uniref:DUF1673 family protein n=1 Tax=Methanosarcina siciliae HI350 TaxID=1434119 RepID=A0A0E3PIT9_9EURY|nr:DUF1673 domain-containing protein [Methanosarcina siciliae]AKB34500.1 hypothetical protein MSSIH_3810 [Methanosarcina siciliae HI350]
MTVIEAFRKLMGWCPMKNSLGNGWQEGNYPFSKMGNGSIQLDPSPVNLRRNKILKVRYSLFDRWTVIVAIFTLIISLLLWIYIPEDSFLIIFSGLIMFLIPLILFLNRPNIAEVTSGKIIIKRPMRKPLVIEKEDVMQISVTRTENHYLRWLVRSIYVVFIPLYFVKEIMPTLQEMERSFPEYIDLSLFLLNLTVLVMFLVMFYNFELMAPYQRILKVTARSNLELSFFTDDPEKLTGILKKEEE